MCPSNMPLHKQRNMKCSTNPYVRSAAISIGRPMRYGRYAAVWFAQTICHRLRTAICVGQLMRQTIYHHSSGAINIDLSICHHYRAAMCIGRIIRSTENHVVLSKVCHKQPHVCYFVGVITYLYEHQTFMPTRIITKSMISKNRYTPIYKAFIVNHLVRDYGIPLGLSL